MGDCLDDDAGLALEELESPALNTTMFAVPPFGTVTTQKLAPPAPVAELGLVTSLTLLTAGSIEHGKPLQVPPEQVIFIPQVGSVLAKSESV